MNKDNVIASLMKMIVRSFHRVINTGKIEMITIFASHFVIYYPINLLRSEIRSVKRRKISVEWKQWKNIKFLKKIILETFKRHV